MLYNISILCITTILGLAIGMGGFNLTKEPAEAKASVPNKFSQTLINSNKEIDDILQQE